jgi:hypothetical protein
VLAGISRLSNEVSDALDYIPAYDQRAYSQAIKALTEKLNEATGKFAPKSRFQFKPRAPKPENATGAPSAPQHDPRQLFSDRPSGGNGGDDKQDEAAATDGEDRDAVGGLPNFGRNYNAEMSRPLGGMTSGIRKPSFSTAKNIAIYDQTGLHIILPSTASRATSSGSLTNLERCIVDMTVPTSSGAPFAGLAIKNVRKSLLICGVVAGAVHITGLKNCVVVVAARQVRVHECENVDLYLHCASHPIIEDCKGMRFAPVPKAYVSAAQPASFPATRPKWLTLLQTENSEETSKNQWDQVDDFKWLKTEPSPNWSVLPEEKILSEEIWTKVVCGNPSFSTDDILRKVGVLSS